MTPKDELLNYKHKNKSKNSYVLYHNYVYGLKGGVSFRFKSGFAGRAPPRGHPPPLQESWWETSPPFCPDFQRLTVLSDCQTKLVCTVAIFLGGAPPPAAAFKTGSLARSHAVGGDCGSRMESLRKPGFLGRITAVTHHENISDLSRGVWSIAQHVCNND